MTDVLLRLAVSNLCVSLVLAIVAWVVHRTGRRPHVAHVLWLLVLAKLMTPPIVTLPVVPLPAPTAYAAETPSDVAGFEPASVGTSVSHLDGARTTLDQGIFGIGTGAEFVEYAKTGLLLLWVFGSVCVLVWSLVRIYRFNRLLHLASEVASPEVQRTASQIAVRLGLKSTPTIYTTSAHLSPMVWWLGGRVRIIIPGALQREAEGGQLRWILAHELAHVRRRDHLVRWLEWLACVCFWWNPVAWWARRNLRMNEEICCDALVLSSLEPKPQTYANALMKVVEFLASPAIRPPAMASEINSGGFLERRFRMIVSNNPIGKTPRWLHACILFMALALLPLGVGFFETASAESNAEDPAAKPLSEPGDTTAQDANAIPHAAPAAAVRKLFGKNVADALTETESGMSYADITVGDGPRSPELVQNIEYQYRGLFLNGEEFDSSYDRGEPPVQELGSMILGLQEAFSTMTEGGHRIVVVPPELAYKAAGLPGIIPPSSTLIYELELLAIGGEQNERVEGDRSRDERTHLDDDIRDRKEGMVRRIAGALSEAGIPRDNIRDVMGSIKKIVAEVRSEADGFELDPRMLEYLEGIGLTDEQIELVVGLSKRLASRPADDDHARRDHIRGRIVGVLMDNGVARENVEVVMGTLRPIISEMQREGDAFELDPGAREQLEDMGLTDEQIALVERIAQRLAARKVEEVLNRQELIRHKIEGAVERGDLTREQADAKYRAIKERMAEEETPGDR